MSSSPLLLALDTSTDACSVALLGAGHCEQRFEVIPRGHGARLLAMVNEVLASAGVKLPDLDAIAFGAGPGAFTGLRIAAGAAQGLAFALDRPVIPVSTLAALAISVRRNACMSEGQTIQVVTLQDARMNEVYVGDYRVSHHELEALRPDSVRPPEQVEWTSEPLSRIILGSGHIYRERLPAALLADALILDDVIFPEAQDVASLALESFRQGRLLKPEEAQPVYLRDEVAWKKVGQQ